MYQPLSIDKLMTTPVDIDVIASSLDKVYGFHVQASAMDGNPERHADHGAALLIERAVLAELEDPEPANYPSARGEGISEAYFPPDTLNPDDGA